MRGAPTFMLSCAIGATLVAQQAPPRDTRTPSADTATVSGRVTDKHTGQPLRRINVQLMGSSPAAQMRPPQAVTDADGRYELTDVPAGDYHASAGPDEFGAGYQPKTFGIEEGSPAFYIRPTLSLKPGEKRRDVDFALARSYAVEGRITNELGDPLADVTVFSERIDRPGWTQPTATTDDRGHFRLYGFAPGSWRVCANTSNRDDAAGDDDIETRFVKTCYPPVTAGKAAAIDITEKDVTGIGILMRRERAYTVSGVVVDESGARVDNASVEIDRISRDRIQFGTGMVEIVRGAFVARGLTPGDYAIRAAVRDPRGRDTQPSTGSRPLALVPIRLDASDIGGVVLVLTRGVDVAGRIIFDGEPAPASRGVRIGARRDAESAQLYRNVNIPPAAIARDDLTFELPGVHGPVTLDVMNAPTGWLVKAIRYGNADINGVSTEFSPGPASRGVEVVLTNRIARVTVRPLDDSGRPVPALAFVFPADTAGWKRAALNPLFPQADGNIAAVSRLPGDYAIVAVAPEDATRVAGNADVLKTLADDAPRVTLQAGDHPTIEVRISRLPR